MSKIEKVAVIGAGIMGAGIASAIFRKKMAVTLFDVDQKMLADSVEGIRKGARRGMDPNLVQGAATMEEAVKDVDLVIEAIVENMDVKKKVFAEMDKHAGPNTIFASNTSSLSIAQMAEATNRKDHFVGLHFFNPAVIMRLVEIILTPETSQEVTDTVTAFVSDIRKTGVKVKESPGFVVNRILVPLVNEAFYLLDEFKKDFDDDEIKCALDIDAAMEKENILLMGPFNLADMIGLDTAFSVAEIIYDGFKGKKCYEPSSFFRSYYDQKFFGRKAGRGVYYYGSEEIDPDKNPNLDQNKNSVTAPDAPKFNWEILTAAMVNEAFRLLDENIVESFKDVETCVELGARWPKGPFALAKQMGVKRVIEVLNERKQATGHDRYEPSPLLSNLTEELVNYFNE